MSPITYIRHWGLYSVWGKCPCQVPVYPVKYVSIFSLFLCIFAFGFSVCLWVFLVCFHCEFVFFGEFVCLGFGAVLDFSDQILFGMRGFKLKNNSSLTFCSSYLDCKRFPPYIFLWRSKQTNICGSTFCASSGWALLDDYVCISRSSARLSGSLQAIHTGALGGVFKEGGLCCLWRKREGSDEKLLLDVSFWVAWRHFQLVERQPTPVWDHQTQNPAVRNCTGCLWRGSKVLAAAGTLKSESFQSSGLVPRCFCPLDTNKPREQQHCHITMSHQPAEPLGREQEWRGKLFQQGTGDRDSTLKTTGSFGRGMEK